MSLPNDVDLSTIRLPDKITDRGTQTKMVDFALAIDKMRSKLHAGLTDLGSVTITWNCGVEKNFAGTSISWYEILKPGGVVTMLGPRFLNLLLKIDEYWKRNENARQKRDTKRKTFYWNDLLDMTAKESTYTLFSSTDTVREGDSFTITLTADNVDAGVYVGYNITGVDSAVISGAQKYGNIIVGGPQIRSYTVAADSISSNKTFNFILSPADTAGTLTESPSLSVTFENIVAPEYSLIGPDIDPVPHSTGFTVTIGVDNFISGSSVGYQFSGVEPSFVGKDSNTDTVNINSDTNIIQFSSNTVGNDMIMTFTLDPTDSNGYGTGEPSVQFTLRASLLDPED